MKCSFKKLVSLALVLVLSVAMSIPTFAAVTNTNSLVRNTVTVGKATAKVSKVMTYNEIVNEIAKDNNISRATAMKIVGSSSGVTLDSERPTYRTFTETVPLWTNYQPTIKFYCQTSESGHFHGIVKIMDVALNRVYKGKSKQFSGTLYTNLEDANTIYYDLSGDFYDNGTTTVSGGGGIGVGGVLNLNFNVSYSSNWFGTASYDDRFTW